LGRITGFNRKQCQKCSETLREAAKKIYWRYLKNLQIRQHRKGVIRVLGPVPPSSAASNATTATLFLFKISLPMNDRGA